MRLPSLRIPKNTSTGITTLQCRASEKATGSHAPLRRLRQGGPEQIRCGIVLLLLALLLRICTSEISKGPATAATARRRLICLRSGVSKYTPTLLLLLCWRIRGLDPVEKTTTATCIGRCPCGGTSPNKLEVCAGCDAVVVGLVFREPKRDGFVDGVGAWRLNIEDIVGRRTL